MVKILFCPHQRLLLILACCVVLLLNGCAKTTQFDDVWESSLKGCGLNCHTPGGLASDGPDMSSQDKFYANTVGKTVGADYPDWEKTGDCDNVPFIKPGDADNSLIIAAMVSSANDALVMDTPDCNTAGYNNHIVNKAALVSDWKELIQWINDGAPKE